MTRQPTQAGRRVPRLSYPARSGGSYASQTEMRALAGAGTARRSRAGCIQVERSGGLTRCGLGPEPDPRLSYQARTWLIRSRTGFIRVGRSGSQQAPHAADLGRSQTHKLWLFRSRTGPTGQVRVGWSGSPTRCEPGQEPSPTGPEPIDPRYSSVVRARDAKARTALMRQEATSKDLGLRLCLALSHGLYPMCSDSDGF